MAVVRKKGSLVKAVLLGVAIFMQSSGAHARSGRRDKHKDVPDVALSGYTVPVHGGSGTLSSPNPDKRLTYLALGRGSLSYSCTNRKSFQPPVYVSQTTNLWDAAPLIPRIASESEFHTIIPQLYEFDYTDLANSTLVCIGTIGTSQGQSTIDLFEQGKIPVSIEQTVSAPSQPKHNLEWACEVSLDHAWMIYRVETAGGKPPATCLMQAQEISVPYTAEYWFYHA